MRELYTGDPFPSATSEGLPAGVAVLIQRCTDIDPNKRYQNITELRRAFVSFTSGRQVSAEEELQKLIKVVEDQSGSSNQQLRELVDLIVQCQEETELMHEVTMKLPQATFQSMAELHREVARLLVRRFDESCRRNDFDFNYTDAIGNTCRKLHEATNDPEIRALLASTALQLGVNYNRWHVMGIAGSLIQSARDDNAAVAMFAQIQPLQSALVAISNDYINAKKLHPILRTLLEVDGGAPAAPAS